MTEQRLREIEERANAATKGPLTCEEFHRHRWHVQTAMVDGEADVVATDVDPKDGVLFANARTDVLNLVAEVRALRKLLMLAAREDQGEISAAEKK